MGRGLRSLPGRLFFIVIFVLAPPALPTHARQDQGEITVNPNVINVNRGFATKGQQHLLLLKNENLPGLFGEAQGDGPGVPRTTHTVAINVATCLRVSEAELQSTIAHEMAHAANVWHHGDSDYQVTYFEEKDATGAWKRYTWTDGNPRTAAAQGGQHSGVEQCIMRYEGVSLYETPGGTMRWDKGGGWQLGAKYGPHEGPGHLFCKTPDGTGVNAPGRPGGPKAGNATKGACRYQFCVNDQKH